MQKHQKECGSGLLELALALPTALLLFFLVLDCGFALQQRGRFRDAVRTAVHSQSLVFRENERAGGGSVLQELAEHLAQEIKFRLLGSAEDIMRQQAFSLTIAPLALEFDPDTGHLQRYTLGGSLVVVRDGQTSELPSESLRAAFLTQLADEEHLREQSQFAIPLSPLPGAPSRQYLSTANALLISIHAQAPGLPQSPFRDIFRNISEIDNFSVVPLREQLG